MPHSSTLDVGVPLWCVSFLIYLFWSGLDPEKWRKTTFLPLYQRSLFQGQAVQLLGCIYGFSGRNYNQTKKTHPPRQPGFQRWKVEFSLGETGKRLLGKVLIVGGKNPGLEAATWEFRAIGQLKVGRKNHMLFYLVTWEFFVEGWYLFCYLIKLSWIVCCKLSPRWGPWDLGLLKNHRTKFSSKVND